MNHITNSLIKVNDNRNRIDPIIKGRTMTLGRIARWNRLVILGRIMREVMGLYGNMGGLWFLVLGWEGSNDP